MLILVLVALGLADIATTIVGLRNGATEANPVASYLFNKLGAVPAMLILKTACTATIVMVSAHWPIVGYIAIAGYAYVLVNNVRVIRNGL